MSVLAHEIMTPTIKAVPHNWTMDRLARFLTDNEITGSPVTDEHGAPGSADIVSDQRAHAPAGAAGILGGAGKHMKS